MKKFTILLASLAVMASSVPAFAGKDRIITVGELPAVAQQFVQTHFKAVEVSYAKVDEELFDKDYKVVFVNGSKVEFDAKVRNDTPGEADYNRNGGILQYVLRNMIKS